jgi:drug/metabolite transporter (DMT)-like permease
MRETLSINPYASAASHSRIYPQLTMVSVIWGGTFIAGRLLTGIPPLMAASLRFLIASGILLAFLGLSHTPLVRISMRQGVQALALGFFGIFTYNICFFYGLHYITASRASLIVALNPAMIALNHIDRQQWLGLLYLGALGSALAYIWYYRGIQKIGATRAGVFIALNPITAVLCGALWLDEPLSLQIGIGGVLVVIGIVLSNQFTDRSNGQGGKA